MRSLLLILCFISCASGVRDQQTKILEEFKDKNFESALSELEESKFKEDEKLKLLYLMEKGSLLYYSKNFQKAARVYSEANELVDKLYTKSVREQLASSLINDNSKTFYGSVFERSLLFYYQAMSFYKLSQQDSYQDSKGKTVKISSIEKDGYLNSARSTLLAWDTFFEDLKRSSNFKSILQVDLTSKLMAAKIHEQIGTRRDLEIALQLYKDAQDSLKRFAPAYKIFNEDYIEYNKNLAAVLNEEKKGKDLKFEKKSLFYSEGEKFIDQNILRLSKILRPKEYRALKNKLKLDEPKFLNQQVDVVVELGFINRLQSKNFAFNLNTALQNIEDPGTRAVVEGIGVPVLTYFALGELGLGYVTRTENLTIYSGHNAGMELTKELGVEFKLPFVEAPGELNTFVINVINEEDKVVTSKPLIIMNSLNDLSFINSQEMIEASFTKRSLRVGLKYVAAITAAYATYKQMEKNNGVLIARATALTQFLLSAKAISATEAADDRHWATLPAYLTQVQLDLPPGKYKLELVESSLNAETPSKKQILGDLNIDPNKQSLFSYRAF